MTAGLDHIGVVVSDLDRALGFWHGLIGLPVTGRGEAGWPHLSELNGLAGSDARLVHAGPGHWRCWN